MPGYFLWPGFFLSNIYFSHFLREKRYTSLLISKIGIMKTTYLEPKTKFITLSLSSTICSEPYVGSEPYIPPTYIDPAIPVDVL